MLRAQPSAGWGGSATPCSEVKTGGGGVEGTPYFTLVFDGMAG
jgi:hypothetical protein